MSAYLLNMICLILQLLYKIVYLYEFSYNFATVLYQFLETGTSDRTLIFILQRLRFSGFILYIIHHYSFTVPLSLKSCVFLIITPLYCRAIEKNKNVFNFLICNSKKRIKSLPQTHIFKSLHLNKTWIIWSNRINSLKYLRSTRSIINREMEAKTQFLYFLCIFVRQIKT